MCKPKNRCVTINENTHTPKYFELTHMYIQIFWGIRVILHKMYQFQNFNDSRLAGRENKGIRIFQWKVYQFQTFSFTRLAGCEIFPFFRFCLTSTSWPWPLSRLSPSLDHSSVSRRCSIGYQPTGAQRLWKKSKRKLFWGTCAMFWPSWSHDNLFIAFLARLFVCSLPFLLAAVSSFLAFGCCLCICWLLRWFLWLRSVVHTAVVVDSCCCRCCGWWFLMFVTAAVVVLAVVGGSGCCFCCGRWFWLVSVGGFCCCRCCGRWVWLLSLLWVVVCCHRFFFLPSLFVTVVALFVLLLFWSLVDCCYCGRCSCCYGRCFSLLLLLLRRSLVFAVAVVAATVVGFRVAVVAATVVASRCCFCFFRFVAILVVDWLLLWWSSLLLLQLLAVAVVAAAVIGSCCHCCCFCSHWFSLLLLLLWQSLVLAFAVVAAAVTVAAIPCFHSRVFTPLFWSLLPSLVCFIRIDPRSFGLLWYDKITYVDYCSMTKLHKPKYINT